MIIHPPRDSEPIVAGWTSVDSSICLGLFFVWSLFFWFYYGVVVSWGFFWLVGKRGWCGCEKVLLVALALALLRDSGTWHRPLLCSFLSFGLVAWVLGLGFPSFASLFISPLTSFTSHTFTSAYTPRLERQQFFFSLSFVYLFSLGFFYRVRARLGHTGGGRTGSGDGGILVALFFVAACFTVS